ncbi:MAG: hypothetical protein HON53_11920 [Planctomycetaceae bacterium]|jgi:hypothetical protein|nr:hypothetical protein [Planctomycetaceae bacterium]MBT6157482.1 hypothetical protein [Planctomycetaceae bacterium]MBT6488081.1 hypothetical protein [Planctomycetaceae bacterium]MBT6495290.1 hypothetical protein [Planctomycetaceae bacterium]
MSRLKLYWPEARGQFDAVILSMVSADRAGEPTVIPFAQHQRKATGHSRSTDVVDRAHTIHTNGRCPACLHPVVEPIELNDALVGRGNLPIPGTATLVGFRCDRCECEWQA